MLRQICSCYIIREINILLARRVNQNNALRAPTHISNALMSTSLVNLIDRPSRTKSSLVENENVTSDKSDVGDVFGNLRKGFCEPSRRKEIKTKSAAALKVKSSRRNSHSSKTERCNEDDSDTFGSLGPASRNLIENMPTRDEGEKLMDRYESRTPRRHLDPILFTRQIKDFLKERKLKEALEVLREMIEEARLVPDYYIYNLLISGCGKVGYTRMAFKLYRQMKDRQIKRTPATYTALFNACSNSPWQEDGLKRAHGLYDEVIRKGILLNAINYHAAIKAFGRSGDLQMAFRLVDEMVKNGVGVTCETFNFLLNGCASDRQTGFLQAIRVWKKMREKKVKPDAYSYNLLIRIVRDCSLGDPETAKELLFDTSPSSQSGVYIPPSNILMNQKTDSQSVLNDYESQRNELTVEVTPQLPDILSPSNNSGSVIALQTADTPQERLYMLGGMNGLLHRMSKDRVEPNLKTFTELLEVIPSNLKEEGNLLTALKDKAVTPDVDFFSILIKRRCARGSIIAARDVLTLIAKEGLCVDIATFGTLALSCVDWQSAKQLLNDIENSGFRPNIQIMGALVHKACQTEDFWFLIDMLKRMKIHEVEPDPKLLLELETFVTDTKQIIVNQEKDGVVFSKDDKRIKGFTTFLMYYKQWLKERKVELPQHPWQAYRISKTENDDGDDQEIKRA